MGYRITYSEEKDKPRRLRVIPLTLLLLALFLGWTVRNWKEGSDLILETVFPVTAEIAREAALEMTKKIEAGEGAVQAFTVFCERVFSDGAEGLY